MQKLQVPLVSPKRQWGNPTATTGGRELHAAPPTAHTRKGARRPQDRGLRGEAGGGRPEEGGAWAAKTVKQPPQQPAQPRHANYRAPLTHKRHPPQPTQPQYTNHWALRTRKQHQQEHRPQRPTKCNDPMQHAKGRTDDLSRTPYRNSNPTECHTGGSKWGGVKKRKSPLIPFFFDPVMKFSTLSKKICSEPPIVRFWLRWCGL